MAGESILGVRGVKIFPRDSCYIFNDFASKKMAQVLKMMLRETIRHKGVECVKIFPRDSCYFCIKQSKGFGDDATLSVDSELLFKMATGSGLAILAIFNGFESKTIAKVLEMKLHYQLMLGCFSKWRLEVLMILLYTKLFCFRKNGECVGSVKLASQ